MRCDPVPQHDNLKSRWSLPVGIHTPLHALHCIAFTVSDDKTSRQNSHHTTTIPARTGFHPRTGGGGGFFLIYPNYCIPPSPSHQLVAFLLPCFFLFVTLHSGRPGLACIACPSVAIAPALFEFASCSLRSRILHYCMEGIMGDRQIDRLIALGAGIFGAGVFAFSVFDCGR
jgi:hypothetical protein